MSQRQQVYQIYKEKYPGLYEIFIKASTESDWKEYIDRLVILEAKVNSCHYLGLLTRK
jgi:hypothetical protein